MHVYKVPWYIIEDNLKKIMIELLYSMHAVLLLVLKAWSPKDSILGELKQIFR